MKEKVIKKAIIRYNRENKEFQVDIPDEETPIFYNSFQQCINLCRSLILNGKIKKITNLVRDDIAILE